MSDKTAREIVADLFGEWWTGWDDEAGGPEEGLAERRDAADKLFAALQAEGIVLARKGRYMGNVRPVNVYVPLSREEVGT